MPKNLKKPIAKAIFGFGTDLQIHFGFFNAFFLVEKIKVKNINYNHQREF